MMHDHRVYTAEVAENRGISHVGARVANLGKHMGSAGADSGSPKLYGPGGGTLSAEIQYRRPRSAARDLARVLPGTRGIARTQKSAGVGKNSSSPPRLRGAMTVDLKTTGVAIFVLVGPSQDVAA